MADAVTLEVKAKVSKDWQAVLDCVNMLGAALADHDHQWTPVERRTYERAVRVIERLVEVE